jgi:deazaflavin-dependent oxidoreductase (nitroreductase family)
MRRPGTYVVASGWGEKSNWYRNIQETPHVVINVRRARFEATAVSLSVADAERELLDYARRRPVAFRELAGRMAGLRSNDVEEDYRLLARSIPLVALEPTQSTRR